MKLKLGILFVISLASIPIIYAVTESWIDYDCNTLGGGMIPICNDINILHDRIVTLETTSFIPSGTIHTFAGLNSTIPDGYLRADGAEISRVDYAELFAVIGTQWGVGNNSTTFNLPDFETDNSFLRAANNDAEVSQTGGESTVKLTIDELASHRHDVRRVFNSALSTLTQYPTAITTSVITTHNPTDTNDNSPEAIILDSGFTIFDGLRTSDTGSTQTHENKPPYTSIYFIIKT